MTPAKMADTHAACFTHPRPWHEAEFTDLLNAPQSVFSFVDKGFAVFRQAGPEAELLTIAVHPSVQNTGLGRKLLEDGLSKLKDNNCEEVFLEVATDNLQALALYASAGFERTAIRKDYYDRQSGQKVAAQVMRKML